MAFDGRFGPSFAPGWLLRTAGQHLTQLSLGLRWFPRDRCLPICHVEKMGIAGEKYNPTDGFALGSPVKLSDDSCVGAREEPRFRRGRARLSRFAVEYKADHHGPKARGWSSTVRRGRVHLNDGSGFRLVDASAAFRAAWLVAGSYADDLAGTVGWARTTDLRIHNPAL